MQPVSSNKNEGAEAPATLDAVIVGAGFAGLYMLHRLRTLGFSARIFEAGSGVGGTWFWNRYPGARCDIESLEYSYSFSEELEREWQWSERYASAAGDPPLSQPRRRPIRSPPRHPARYARHLRCLRRVGERVDHSDRSPRAHLGAVLHHGDRLPVRRQSARIPGPGGFPGQVVSHRHTGRTKASTSPANGWASSAPAPLAFSRSRSSPNRRRISTSSSGRRASAFPRTTGRSPPETLDDWKANRRRYRERARNSVFGILAVDPNDRSAVENLPRSAAQTYEERWQRGGFALLGAFADLIVNREANETAAEFVHAKIREIVRDPAVAEKLDPHSVSDRRQAHVRGHRLLRDLQSRKRDARGRVGDTPIREITPSGIRASDREYALDSIVFATGFDAMTGALSRIEIRGRGGVTLQERWAAGPRTYLGLMVAGFPNLFTITGPGSPSVLSNMVLSIEHHVEWIADCLALPPHAHVSADRSQRPTPKTAWVDHVNEVAELHAVSARRILVRRRQCARQAARLHAVHRRCRPVSPEMPRGRGERLCGIHPLRARRPSAWVAAPG